MSRRNMAEILPIRRKTLSDQLKKNDSTSLLTKSRSS